jgi:protein-tyrosine phosphatase
MRAAAERRGIHLPSRARQIQPADLTSFDRILTMDADNLQAVRSLAATGLPGGRQQLAIIEPMTSHCLRFSDAEVPDPYYGGEAGFEHVLDLLEDACSGLLATLRRG